MRKFRNLVIGGLQQKVFNLFLITMVLVIAAYSAILAYQLSALRSLVGGAAQEQQASIEQISSDTMNTVIRESLNTSTQLEALIADNVFSELKGEVSMLSDYTEKLFSDPGVYPSQPVALPDKANDGAASVQLLTESGVDVRDPQIAAQIGLLGNLSDMMTSMFDNAQINSCFAATPDGIAVIADDRAGAKFAEDGSLVHLPIRSRPWYIGAAESGKLFFTDVEKDSFTENIGIVCSLPVYADGRLVAVVGADLFLNSMSEAIASYGNESSFVCIINQNGHLLFGPEWQKVFPQQDGESHPDLRESGEKELAQFVTDALSGATELRTVKIGDAAYYMMGVPMQTVGWTVISVVNKEAAHMPTAMQLSGIESINAVAQETFAKSINRSFVTILVLLFIIFVAGTAISLAFAKKIVKPLNTMTERVQELGGDNLQFMMEDTYRTGDEIEVLATQFASLSEKTCRYIEQIAAITAEKERIGVELDMAKSIQESQLPNIFPAFPDRPSFDIYASMTPAKEVGGDFYDFFLIDDDHLCMVIADVSGKGVPAALFMMITKILIKTRLQSGESPAQALTNVNHQFLEGNQTDMFVTVWLSVLEISTGKGIAANAGHEHPALRRANGKYELVKYRHSPAVGTLDGIRFREHTFELFPGDSLFVYTDGVAEAANADNELFGTEKMLAALNRDPDAPPQQTLHNVAEGIEAFVNGTEQFDDITMMCLRYNAAQETRAGQKTGKAETDASHPITE